MKRLLAFALCAGCGGTTGSQLVTFHAQAGGPADAVAPLDFDTGSGYHVSLTRALLRFGAVYLNTAVKTSGAAPSSCVLPGIYVAEAFGPVSIDLLSPALVPFPVIGEGTMTRATTAEVWLTSGDVNAPTDPTVVLDIAGTASSAAGTWPFQGTVTISSNRAIPVQTPALPGANPICKQRIVTPIVVDLTPTAGGTLTLRVDPRGMFNGVDFAGLGTSTTIPDSAAGTGGALFKGLLASAGVYHFTWSN